MLKAKTQVIVLGANASMRVRRGALEIDHGPVAERVNLKLDIDDPPPCAILFDGRGGLLSGEALRWCAQRGVVIVMPDGPGRILTFVHSATEAAKAAQVTETGVVEDDDDDIGRAGGRAGKRWPPGGAASPLADWHASITGIP